MTKIECWACGCMAVAGKTCACGHFVTDRCDAYVYDQEDGPVDTHRRVRRWYWKCHHCGQKAGPFRRRMDADESSGQHMFGEEVGRASVEKRALKKRRQIAAHTRSRVDEMTGKTPGMSRPRYFYCDQCGASVACYLDAEVEMARKHHRCPVPDGISVIKHVVDTWRGDHDRPHCQVCSSPPGKLLLGFVDDLRSDSAGPTWQ